MMASTTYRVLDHHSPSPSHLFNLAYPTSVVMLDRVYQRLKGQRDLLPDFHSEELQHVEHILDLSCGGGSWDVDLAWRCQDRDVLGVEREPALVLYAQARAQARDLDNVCFRHWDIRQGLDMPDQSIDLIHGCFLSAGLRIQAWPALLRECKRVLRPGGIISLIEGERIVTNQPVLACFFDLLAQARHQAGQIIENSESGWSLGEHLEEWLHEIGCQDIQRRASMLDLSPDPNGHAALFPSLD